ncbi:cupin domain-containing protein [Burkholderia plantarii]|uniref:cupin domain-containing protein n=1 Tax=Burkholderia plantarii TaxID=41899 RepID=UPI0018DCFA6C|nr:cupin domain-containing protein [Burkholderia plantarii]MBI0325525.1 cupin domain-containing protein [Burkholderia plantarii]
MQRTARVALAALIVAAASVAHAQGSGISRTEVLNEDVSVPGRHAVVARVEVPPGAQLGWHTHFGDEISYVTTGDLTLMVAGKPQQTVHAGGAFVVPAGIAHGVRNDGTTPVELVTVHVVDKGKPLATPASAPVATQ